MVDNGFATSLPKFDSGLIEELTETGFEQFTLANGALENNVGKQSCLLTFYTYLEEPIGESELYLNWGVFSSSVDYDVQNVYGQARPYEYTNTVSYSDAFDRLFLFLGFFTSAIASFLGPLGWPIQFVIYTTLALYVSFVASFQLKNVSQE